MKITKSNGKKQSNCPSPQNDETTMTTTTRATECTAAIFYEPLKADMFEHVRCTIKDAHVFKLPTRKSATAWRGAEWNEKVWQGAVKVVERGEASAVIFVDKMNGSLFAVCPLREGAVDRCIDSSRYFVLRVENAQGKHMFIGMAFNERNDAFDFNAALEDLKREEEAAKNPPQAFIGPSKDYSIKEGQKIHVNIPKRIENSCSSDEKSLDGNKLKAPVKKGFSPTKALSMKSLFGGGDKSSSGKKKPGKKKDGGILLAPSSKDTPSRINSRRGQIST